MKTSLLSIARWAALLAVMPAVYAQQYPMKPVRLVIGFAAGGPSDVLARIVGQKLTQSLGQQTIIDFHPGAAGNIAAEIVAKAPPDGYTLLVPTFSLAVNASMYSKLPFDALKSFAPVALLASVPMVLVTHPSLPVNSVQQLIALAKAHPGEITYASAGYGTTSHLAGELLNMMAGIKLINIPYKGIAPAHTDLIGGQVPILFDSMAVALPAVKAGRLRALAVSTIKRSAGAPELPTMSESGLAGYDVNAWYGLLAPAGTSREIVQRMNSEVNRALREPDVRERFAALGAEPMISSPEEFTAYIIAETAKWAKVVKAAGLRAN